MKEKKNKTDLCQYLCVSTLQPWLTHMVSALLFLGKVAILSISMCLLVRFN